MLQKENDFEILGFEMPLIDIPTEDDVRKNGVKLLLNIIQMFILVIRTQKKNSRKQVMRMIILKILKK